MKNFVSSLVASAALVALATLPFAAHATVYQFNASLTGLQETPANLSTGTGVATLFYNDNGTALTTDDSYSFSLSAFGLSGTATGAHIHAPGTVGATGPIVVPLDTAPFTIFNSGGTVLIGGAGVAAPNASFLSQLQAGLAYVNLHTTLFPAGEIRGQLVQVAMTSAVPEPATYALLGAGLLLIGVFASSRRDGSDD